MARRMIETTIDQPDRRRDGRWVLRGVSNILAGVALASPLNGSTVNGAVPMRMEDSYTGPAVISDSPFPSATITPTVETSPSPSITITEATASPTTVNTTPVPSPTLKPSTCREGEAETVDWGVMGIHGAGIEAFGLDPVTHGLAKTTDRHAFGVYSGGPKIGSAQGNVLTGGERYANGDSVLPADYERRLATVAKGSVMTFHMKDGGTCYYTIDTTFPRVSKYGRPTDGAPDETEYAEYVRKYNLYSTFGRAALEVEGCTGPWDPVHDTSYFTGIALGYLSYADGTPFTPEGK